MNNITAMLGELENRLIISEAVRIMIQDFFHTKICIENDLTRSEAAEVIGIISNMCFNSELNLGVDWIQGENRSKVVIFLTKALCASETNPEDVSKILAICTEVIERLRSIKPT